LQDLFCKYYHLLVYHTTSLDLPFNFVMFVYSPTLKWEIGNFINILKKMDGGLKFSLRQYSTSCFI